MPHLLEALDFLKEKLVLVHIYMAEAHADDVWPLGYGINSSKTTDERWANADRMFAKYEGLLPKYDHVFCDNMENDFNTITGAWPEAYFFATKEGSCLVKVENQPGPKGCFSVVEKYAKRHGWWTE